MAMDTKRQFNRRAFATMLTLISGLGLPITGLMNHIYGLEGLTPRHHIWMSAHNSLAIVFTVAAAWHVVLNRRTLYHHIKSTADSMNGISREFAWAVGIVIVIFTLIVGHAFHAK
jgi:hypothetical protein